ncbi:Appr-1-p processing [Penicillium digitatum]|uniref:Appr-1-p processing n=1 Tax=Penicillium digitatum TaxID=36651 RepID=A0A7T7BJK9_PENDI|nr:Appr-1-p processing [Penicillium digitatum]
MTSSFPVAVSFVQETPGDLFDAPNGAALIHACNCQGVWGAGIARAFRERYPTAYEIYRNHCLTYRSHPVTKMITDLRDEDPLPSLVVPGPLGTALLIPPQKSDFILHRRRHWIICLFTSEKYRMRVDSEDIIVNSTFAALQDLSRQLQVLPQQASETGNERPQSIYSSRFCTVSMCTTYPFEARNRRPRPIHMARPSEVEQD